MFGLERQDFSQFVRKRHLLTDDDEVAIARTETRFALSEIKVGADDLTGYFCYLSLRLTK